MCPNQNQYCLNGSCTFDDIRVHIAFEPALLYHRQITIFRSYMSNEYGFSFSFDATQQQYKCTITSNQINGYVVSSTTFYSIDRPTINVINIFSTVSGIGTGRSSSWSHARNQQVRFRLFPILLIAKYGDDRAKHPFIEWSTLLLL